MQRKVKPFQLGLPALDAFPHKLWPRLAARQARALSAADMAYLRLDQIKELAS